MCAPGILADKSLRLATPRGMRSGENLLGYFGSSRGGSLEATEQVISVSVNMAPWGTDCKSLPT